MSWGLWRERRRGDGSDTRRPAHTRLSDGTQPGDKIYLHFLLRILPRSKIVPYLPLSECCKSLIKVKFSTDQFRHALGSGCRLIDCDHAQKTSKLPYFRLFRPDTQILLPILPYTDLVPPSTNPVPPSTKQYCPILTQYHHGSTITAFYWSIATMYQQVEPHRDPVQ